jgi:hypothetical protein
VPEIASPAPNGCHGRLRTPLARGCSNPEIGAALFITTVTVKSHVANILAKPDIRDRGARRDLRVRERPGRPAELSCPPCRIPG